MSKNEKNTQTTQNETPAVEKTPKLQKGKDNVEALALHGERIEVLKTKLNALPKGDRSNSIGKKLRRQLRALGYKLSKEVNEMVKTEA